MTLLAIGASVTVPLADSGTIFIASNGGFASVVVTPTVGAQQTISIGPIADRRVIGPFAEGGSAVVTNLSCNALDYYAQSQIDRATVGPLSGVTSLVVSNSTAPTSAYVYNTLTDASNYERGIFDWTTTANVLTIGTVNAGTGIAREMRIRIGNFDYLRFGASSFSSAGNGTIDAGTATQGWKRFYVDYTNTATIGAVTINKAAGRVNIAAAATSVVVTNSFCTANAKVFCNIQTADTTAKTAQATSAAGSFTITLNAAATAQVAIDFFIVNSD